MVKSIRCDALGNDILPKCDRVEYVPNGHEQQ